VQLTALVYLLAGVGIALIVLGGYGIIRDRFSQVTRGTAPGVSFTLPLSAFVLLMGVGSILGAGYLSLNSTKNAAAKPVPPSHTVSPAPSTPTSTGTHRASGAVSITHPVFGARVGECGVFTGTSDLPPGQTLVLSAQNLSDPSKVIYLEAVNNWNKPADLSDWTGYQYFGSGDTSVGQTFEVSIIVIKTGTVAAALAEPTNNPVWHVKSLPNGSKVKQTLRVVRMKGPGPAVCH